MSSARTRYRIQERTADVSLWPVHKIQVDVLAPKGGERRVERSLNIGVLPISTKRT
jgi:hypothetical protein